MEGTDIPIVANVFTDFERIAMAFGTGAKDLDRVLRERGGKPVEPVMVDDVPVRKVVWTGNDVDLNKLAYLVSQMSHQPNTQPFQPFAFAAGLC